MNKNKIADSIIIRVGGGIREVPRKPVDIAENLETEIQDSSFEQVEDVQPFGANMMENSKMKSDTVIS